MKKELKGFCVGALLTSTVLFCIPAFADSIVKSIKVTVNTITVKVNGNKVTADNFLYNGRTYVQLRSICDLLGKDLSWDKATNTADIKDKKTDDTQKNQQGQQEGNKDTKQPQSNDTTKPTVTSVTTINGNTVEVLFSEKLDRASAEKVSNYSAAQMYGKKASLSISKAELDSIGTKVTLTTDGQEAATLYNISISNVCDAAGNIMDKSSNTLVGMGNGTSNSTPSDSTAKFEATYVKANSLTSLEIGFANKVDQVTAESIANYKINEKYGSKDNVAVVNAELSSDGKKVILTTAAMKLNILYSISFTDIKDIYGGMIDITKPLVFVANPQ